MLEVLNDTTVVGHKLVNSWPGIRNVYFAMVLSSPIKEFVNKDQWVEKDMQRLKTNALKTSGIKIDGKPDETSWHFQNQITRVISGDSDNKASFATAWDDTYLYVAVRVEDKDLYTDSNNPWEDDGMEMYIDGNNYPRQAKENKGLIAALTFQADELTELMVKVGLSTTSTEAALHAINEEIPHWDFRKVRKASAELWENKLKKIEAPRSRAPRNLRSFILIFYCAR